MDLKDRFLTDAHLAQFQQDGYLVVPAMFGAEQMRAITDWTDEVVGLLETPGKHMVYYEDSLLNPSERVLCRVENFCPYHEGMNGLFNDGIVFQCVSELLGENAILFKEKINFKMPGGDGFKAHQDVQAGWDEYADLHLTMLLSIDEATPENGCLEVAPGAHKMGLIGEMWKPLEENIPGVNYISCPTRPGDAIFFDSFIPHKSAPNLTDKPRRVLYVTYNRTSAGDHRAAYYAAKRKSFPPDCEREAGKTYAFRV